jgi:hypothetical protein
MNLKNKGMEMMNGNHVVKLSNGSEVTWDEFSRWNGSRQTMALKGKKLPADFGSKRAKIMRDGYASGKIDKAKFQRRVMTPLGEFASIKLTAEAYGVLGQTIHWWIERSRKPGFYFLDPKYIQKKRPKEESKAGMKSAKPLMTPDGVFPTMRAAAEHYGVIKDSIRNWLKKKPHEFYLLEKDV